MTFFPLFHVVFYLTDLDKSVRYNGGNPFCAHCVDAVLGNVCPNCGGGFVSRPIRPSRNWKGDNFLGNDPASTLVKHRPIDPNAHAKFSAAIKIILPEKR